MAAKAGGEEWVATQNIFEELELPEPEERLAKAEVIFQVTQRIQELHLSQREAGRRMGLAQSKVNALMHGRAAGFSLERLFRCLTALGQDVSITIGPPGPKRGQITVSPPVSLVAPGLRAG